MADIDFSKYSNEELMKIAQGAQAQKPSAQPQQEEEPGFLKSALQGYGHYAKGVLKGGGQALGDMGHQQLIGRFPALKNCLVISCLMFLIRIY